MTDSRPRRLRLITQAEPAPLRTPTSSARMLVFVMLYAGVMLAAGAAALVIGLAR